MSKKKSKKKNSGKGGDRTLNALGENIGKVGAAIAGVVLTEVAQGALTKKSHPSANESGTSVKHKSDAAVGNAIDTVKQIAKETLKDTPSAQASVHHVIDAVKQALVDQPADVAGASLSAAGNDVTEAVQPAISAVGDTLSNAVTEATSAGSAANLVKAAIAEVMPAEKTKGKKKKGKKTKSKKSSKGKKG